MPIRGDPTIYEINTWVWLSDLGKRFGRAVTLGNVPPEAVDEIAAWCPDVVWMMGVWERSPRGREIALKHPDLQSEFDHVKPDFTPADIAGSPYSVHRYQVDSRLGGPEGLAVFRSQLRKHNIGLFLDYVPNHVALDHHWTIDCPDCLVRGTEEELKIRSTFYYRTENGNIYAHGRDPYWPPWTDTAQVNVFSRAGREQTLDQILRIAAQCDGVRCDMAMLVVNRVFKDLWAKDAQAPQAEFWEEIIPPVKKKHPGFIFLAEVYWQMEAELQSLGFDFTYDKRLYDRLKRETVHSIRDHLLAASSYQKRMVRFIENHDEERAIAGFGLEKSQAAAVLTLTLPGAKLIHEGQFEGRRIKLPVQFAVRPHEPPIESLAIFYQTLTREMNKAPYHEGTFMTLAAHPILADDRGHENLFAYAWVLGSDWRIIVVNYSDQPVEGRIMLPRPDFAGLLTWKFYDALNPGVPPVLHIGDDLLTSGLPIDLGAYRAHLFAVERG